MEAYSSETDEIVFQGFDKLYEHIMLEIVRLRDNYKTFNNLSLSLENSRKQVEEAQKETEEAKQNIEATIKTAQELQSQVVMANEKD